MDIFNHIISFLDSDIVCTATHWINPWCPDENVKGATSGDFGTWFGSWGQWAGAIATIFGFFFIWKQIGREQRSLETQTSWTMYETSIGVLNVFVEHPELRPYFYDGVPLPTTDSKDLGPTRSQVLAVAEVVADHLENIVNSGEDGAIDENTYYVWVKYMYLLGLRSPTMQAFLSDKPHDDIAKGTLRFGEGQRYGNAFKNILIKGQIPELCRTQFEQERSSKPPDGEGRLVDRMHIAQKSAPCPIPPGKLWEIHCRAIPSRPDTPAQALADGARLLWWLATTIPTLIVIALWWVWTFIHCTVMTCSDCKEKR
jgi:hypothetical protein